MPIGSTFVYNPGDLIAHTVSSSGTTFQEVKLAAATSSLILFNANGVLTSQSLVVTTVGTASSLIQSNSYQITNLTASGNISSSGVITAQSFTGSVFGTSSWANNVTGLTSGSANYIPLWNSSTALTRSVLFQSASNIGVGTTAPIVLLDIATNPSTTGLRLAYTNGQQLNFAAGSSGTGIYQSGSGYLALGVNSNGSLGSPSGEAIRITNGGQVGIGTTAPSSILTVYTSNVAGANIDINASGTGNATIRHYRSGSFRFEVGPSGNSNDYLIYNSGISTYSLQIKNTTTGNIFLAPYTGSVGIGTTNPVNILDVDGAMVVGAIYAGVNTAPANGLLVAGNVGIGSTNPVNKLDVVGNISCSVITASLFSGSFSGSYFGTSSWSINTLTASYLVPTNSYQVSNLTASNINATGTGSCGFLNIGSTLTISPQLFSLASNTNSNALNINKTAGTGTVISVTQTNTQQASTGISFVNTDANTSLVNSTLYGVYSSISTGLDSFAQYAGYFSSTQTRNTAGSNGGRPYGIYAIATTTGSAPVGYSAYFVAGDANTIPLTLKSAASQTASIMQILNSAGSPVFVINASGSLSASATGSFGAVGIGTSNINTAMLTVNALTGTSGILVNSASISRAPAAVVIAPPNTTNPGLVVQGLPSQISALMYVETAAGSQVFSVGTASGTMNGAWTMGGGASLTISTGATGNDLLRLSNVAANGKSYYLGSQTDGSFVIRDASAAVDRFKITTSGSVGIGTTPVNTLDVSGNISASNITCSNIGVGTVPSTPFSLDVYNQGGSGIVRLASNTASASPYLTLQRSSSVNDASFGVAGGNGSFLNTGITASVGNTVFKNDNGTGIIFGVGTSGVIFMNGSLNTGLGTGTPVNKLDVVGNISASVVTASLLFGTSSWANALNPALTYSANTFNCTSSNVAVLNVSNYITGNLTGSVFGTSSWALSASNVLTCQTASYLNVGLYSITSSWAVNSLTASSLVAGNNYNVNNLTASGFISASGDVIARAFSGSFSGSITNAITASYALAFSGSITNAVSASYALSASYAPGGSGLSGGTTNYIPLWTSPTGQASSIISQSNNIISISGSLLVTQNLTSSNISSSGTGSFGSIGIGTSTPSALFELSSSTIPSLLNIKGAGGLNILNVSGSGNIGIGTAASNAYKVQISGSFSATTKSFDIVHPTKPNKRLVYGSLESPYHGIRLTGKGTLQNGKCKVVLPDYLNKLIDFDTSNIQITNIKHGYVIFVDDIHSNNNTFTVAAKIPKRNINNSFDFYWTFTATRIDVPSLEVEV